MSNIVFSNSTGVLSASGASIGSITLVAGGSNATCEVTDSVSSGSSATIMSLACLANDTATVSLSGVDANTGVYLEAVSNGTVFVELL